MEVFFTVIEWLIWFTFCELVCRVLIQFHPNYVQNGEGDITRIYIMHICMLYLVISFTYNVG